MHGRENRTDRPLPFEAILGELARERPERAALGSVEGEWLGRAELGERIAGIVSLLADHGAVEGEPVLALLPDGPGTALVALACATRFAYAPLNPRTPAGGLAALAARLAPRLVLVARGASLPDALAHTPCLEVDPASLSEPVGGERGHGSGGGAGGAQADPDAVAFLLPTSGTTGMPRFAVITQGNLAASVENIAQAFELTEHDHRLNVMPLFHVQGIVGGLLAPLCSGGRVTQATGFVATEVLDVIARGEVTWYSGVQAMQREMLLALERRGDFAHGLRFVRTGSSTLDEPLRERLSARLGVPVVSSYGMTEATSQIAVQPFTGGKTGSCGRLAGPRVRLVGPDGEDVSAGSVGEVWIAGENVIGRYHDDESPDSFHGAWLRTGDLGRLDADGFLFLVGRTTDRIRRGGETVEPSEVEARLERHPAVVEAAVLGVADERLGQELVAMVVCDSDGVDPAALKAFVGERLASHKVPRSIRCVESLPSNATGKLVRGELAAVWARLEGERAPSAPPHALSPRVAALEAIWSRLLATEAIDPDADFFDLGGGSLVFEEMLLLVSEEVGVTLDTFDLSGSVTLRTLDALLEEGDSRPWVAVHPAAGEGSSPGDHSSRLLAPPLWLFPPAGGHLVTMGRLAQRLDWPGEVLVLRGPGEDPGEAQGESIEEIAAWYLPHLEARDPGASHAMIGVSFGGLLVFELAKRLRGAGRPPGPLGIIDSVCTTYPHRSGARRFVQQVTAVLRGADLAADATPDAIEAVWQELETVYLQLTALEKPADPRAAARAAMRSLGLDPQLRLDSPHRWCRRLRKVRRTLCALDDYELGTLDAPFTYFRAGAGFAGSDPALGWSAHATSKVDVAVLDGNHFTIWDAERLDPTARTISRILDRMRVEGARRDRS